MSSSLWHHWALLSYCSMKLLNIVIMHCLCQFIFIVWEGRWLVILDMWAYKWNFHEFPNCFSLRLAWCMTSCEFTACVWGGKSSPQSLYIMLKDVKSYLKGNLFFVNSNQWCSVPFSFGKKMSDHISTICLNYGMLVSLHPPHSI